VLLGIDTDVEGGDVYQLLPDADVALFDEDASVVDRFGEALLEDLSLKTALKELLGRKLKDEIELELLLGEESKAGHFPHEGLSLEDPFGILRVEGEEGTGGLTELGKGELNPPDLPLAPKSVLSDELELGIKTLLLVGPPGGLGGLPVVPVHSVGRHGCSEGNESDKRDWEMVSIIQKLGKCKRESDIKMLERRTQSPCIWGSRTEYQNSSIGDNWVFLLLTIGRIGVYQVDQVYDVITGVGGEEIFGISWGSNRGVVVGVLWKNVVGLVVFVDTWGCGRYILICNREGKVRGGRYIIETHYYLLELGSSYFRSETKEMNGEERHLCELWIPVCSHAAGI